MTALEKTYLSGLFFYKPEKLDDLIKYLKMDTIKLPLISIGSGTGYVEYYIKENIPDLEIICVDPNPKSFAKRHPVKHIDPHFGYLSDFDHTKHRYSILLINWPSYGSINEGYDTDSIVKLNPRIICVSYGPCGSSGSNNLISTLAGFEIDPMVAFSTPPPESIKQLSVGESVYNLIYSYTLTLGCGYGFSGKTVRLVIYVRTDYMENFPCKPIILQNNEGNPNNKDCIIS